MEEWKEEYKKLSFIDKARFHWRVRKEEKLEDQRQGIEHDDHQPVDRLKIARELKQARENRKNNVKALSSGKPSYKEPENKMVEYEVKQTPIYQTQKGTLDYAIDQYLMGAVLMGQEKGTYDSYRVLTNLGALSSQEYGNNAENEKNLIAHLERRANQALQQNRPKDFRVERQPRDPSKETNFFHVKKNATFKPQKRIYLNCKKENIAELSSRLMNNFEDLDSYYLKFSSNKQAERVNRSEQIVIYLKDDAQMMEIASRIEKTKQESPELFEGSEHINPFMKNYGGYMAYANQPPSQEIMTKDAQGNDITVKKSVYQNLNGEYETITGSYNAVLAKGIEESLVAGINQMLERDIGLAQSVENMNLGAESKNNSTVYALAILPEILEDNQKKMQLIGNMKGLLAKVSEKNPTLEINGIDKQNQQQFNVDYSK